ncbi:MAG TPA: flagellar FliJ family protein [Stellaceae bacterium]|nr:flagellar FliJ family protein [Stellaceae bacterium]
MSALDSLIRLHRWQLDERRRDLAALDALEGKLRQERARLDAEEKSEQAIAAASSEAATAYGAFARHLVERRQRLDQSLASVAEQIEIAREALADAHRDVKRYEIAAANRALAQRKRLERQQQRVMDDIGIETYRRRGG